jgi:hypothetical protein
LKKYVKARYASNDPYTAIAPICSGAIFVSYGDMCMAEVAVVPLVTHVRQEAVVAEVECGGRVSENLDWCESRQNVSLSSVYVVLFCRGGGCGGGGCGEVAVVVGGGGGGCGG